MPNQIVKGIIGNALTSAAPDHIIAVTNDVFDEELQMYQSEINKSSGVFDISVYNAVEGTPATYADLTAALGNNGENVPSNVRKPGMSVKFIQSSGNKYVQYRLMSNAWSTTVSDWQGVDDEPTAGSVNLVKSGGVYGTLSAKIDKIEVVSEETTYEEVLNETGYPKSGTLSVLGIEQSSGTYYIGKFAIEEGKTYKLRGANVTTRPVYFFYDANDTAIPNSGFQPSDTLAHFYTVKAPAGSVYVRVIGTNNLPGLCDKEVGKVVITRNNEELLNSIGNVDELETTNKTTVVGAINEVVGSIEDVDEKIDGLIEEVSSPNLFDKNNLLVGYYLNPTGNGKLSSGVDNYKMSQPIPVIGGHYYYLAGRDGNLSKSIRCLAEGATSPSSDGIKVLTAASNAEYSNWNLPTVDGSGAVVNGQFKVPLDASYVQFAVSINKNSSQVGNPDTIMLLHVGDTYNPDFVVPEYQPYDPTPIVYIKPDVIPCDTEPKENSENPITSGAVYEALSNIEPTPADSKQLKVLLIGSSHGVNTISMFPVLCKAAGIDIICGNLYTGSATIGLYRPEIQIPYMAKNNIGFQRFAVYENGSWATKTTKTLKYALESYQWDVIIVQRGNTEVQVWDDSMDGFMQYLLDYIKNNCVINNAAYTPRLYFNSGLANGNPYPFATTAKNSQLTFTENIINTAELMRSHWGIDIIPTAVALQYARATCLLDVGAWEPNPSVYGETGTKPDLTYDGQHIDTGIGQYVLACCVFEKIVKDMFNMSVRELKYLPVHSDISGNTVNADASYFTAISEYYSRIGKTAAALACIDGEYKAATVEWLHDKFGSEPIQYTITYNLTGCTVDDDRQTIYDDDVYLAKLTPNSGYSFGENAVIVTMGGEDVTSSVYKSYNGAYAIRIGAITGNIVITAVAS